MHFAILAGYRTIIVENYSCIMIDSRSTALEDRCDEHNATFLCEF